MSHYKPYPAYKDSGVEWLGRVPEHWDIVPLKWCFECLDGKRVPLNSEQRADIKGEVPYWGSGGIVDHIDQFIFDEPLVLLGEDGAPFFDRDRPVAYAIEGQSWINNHIHVLRPLTDYPVAWFVHALNCVEYRHYIDGSTRDKLTQDDMKSIALVIPSSPDEATKAVAHLGRETARIDALVAKKTRFIELLREKRQALITHAVTKGLDSNVKMKDSGVEWLGEVPEHWGVKQLKHVVDPNSSITYGIVQAGPEYEGGVPYIRTSDMSGDELPVSGYPLTSPEIDESYARSRVRLGDIVMSIRASVGKCLPVPDGLSVANLTQGTAKVSPGARITRDYLLAYLNSGAAQVYFDLMAKGATFREITLDALRRTPVLLPPGNEQADIDQFIARHVARLDGLVQLSERSIVMLKEHRSALITAAVTGQIDLREAV